MYGTIGSLKNCGFVDFGASFWTCQLLVFCSVLLCYSFQSFYLFSNFGQAPVRMDEAIRVGEASVKMLKVK